MYIRETINPNNCKQQHPRAFFTGKQRSDDTKPEFFDINKLEQQQQSLANDAYIIQPFQPPEEQREQVERKIQDSSQTTSSTLQFMYFLVHNYIVFAVQFLNGARKP